MKYPKFKNGDNCKYPGRDECNYDDAIHLKRCEYMKCIRMGFWHCIYDPVLIHLIKDKSIEKPAKKNKTNIIIDLVKPK